MEICFAGGQNGGDFVHACDDLATAFRAKRRRLQQGLEHSREALLQIESGIALPATIDIQLPANACQRRAHQPVVHLLGHTPGRGVHLLPTRFEIAQGRPPLRDRCCRPIPLPRGMLDSRDVVIRKRLIAGAPRPEIGRKAFERICL